MFLGNSRLMVAAMFALVGLLCLGGCVKAQDLYKDPKAPEEARLDDLMKRLTMGEKIDLMGGTGFATRAIPRLGIPAMKMSDGPLGVRNDGTSTVLPGGPLTAATWDPQSMQDVGTVIGEELLARPGGKVIILGPGLEHSPHAAVRAQRRVLLRRPLPGRALPRPIT